MWVDSNMLTIFTQCHGLRSLSCSIPKKISENMANLAMQEYANQIASLQGIANLLSSGVLIAAAAGERSG